MPRPRAQCATPKYTSSAASVPGSGAHMLTAAGRPSSQTIVQRSGSTAWVAKWPSRVSCGVRMPARAGQSSVAS